MIQANRSSLPISVVLPARNRQDTIELAIQSVLTQDPPVAEVLVVDDGSDDLTAERIRATATTDARVRYIRRDAGGGANAARWQGVQAATSEWIAFHDSDAMWLPGKAARQLRLAEQSAADATACAFIKVADREVALKGPAKECTVDKPHQVIPANQIDFACLLVRRSSLGPDLLDSDWQRFQDWRCALELLRRDNRLLLDPWVGVVHLTLDGSISENRDAGLTARRQILGSFERSDYLRHPARFGRFRFDLAARSMVARYRSRSQK
jgi:glycosyltransferase involved in cell wall biosynthesis